MLYTIVSKIPFISSNNSKRKILIIFIIGSVLYALLHYYLYSSPINGLFEQLKKYLYYIMAVDFGLAYFLSSKNNNEHNEDEENQEEYSQEELKMIEMENIKRMQMMQQMEMQKRQQLLLQAQGGMVNPEIAKNQIFKSKEQVTTEKKNSEKEKTPEQKAEEKKIKIEKNISDTELPKFERKNIN